MYILMLLVYLLYTASPQKDCDESFFMTHSTQTHAANDLPYSIAEPLKISNKMTARLSQARWTVEIECPWHGG